MTQRRNSNNKRGTGRKTFSILVDGETEKWYLEKLRLHENPAGISIKPDLPQHKSLEDQYAAVLENAKVYDQSIWIVDLDVVIQENKIPLLNKYIAESHNNPKVHILVNTPCLEYWFLQHVSDAGKYFTNGQQVINELVKHKPLTDYAKTLRYFMLTNPDIYARLKNSLDTGIANARKRGKYEPNNPQKGKAEMYRLFTILGLKEERE